ncbi:MAG: dockerin type I repeat-containing protein [Deltaproteobacteria bacterium]
MPPDYLVPTTGADFTAPQVTLPALPMTDANKDGIFQFTYSNFIYTGDYRITFYARNANGNVSVSAPTVVEVSGGADPFIRGDINGDRQITLADAILALQLLGRFPPAGQIINPRSDINNDGKIGLAEAIYLLQKVAETR